MFPRSECHGGHSLQAERKGVRATARAFFVKRVEVELSKNASHACATIQRSMLEEWVAQVQERSAISGQRSAVSSQ